MGAVLLGRPAAVAVGQAGLDAREVVLDPLGIGRGRVGVEADPLAGDVDAASLEVIEGGPHGGVVEGGVAGGHLRRGVAENPVHDVLGHAVVDHPGPEGVAELMCGDANGLAGLVVQADGVLPAS